MIKLALICTPGGHYEQMLNLIDLYQAYPHFWITALTTQTEELARTCPTYFINMAHFKKPWTYLRQIPAVARAFHREKPTHILSTGSGRIVLMPFLMSLFSRTKFIHIETFSHVSTLTKMGKFISALGFPVYSQWEYPQKKNSIYIGPILKDEADSSESQAKKEHVFVTLGTRAEPFPRLIQAVEALIKDGAIKHKVIVQAGSTLYSPGLFEAFDYCPPEKIDDLIRRSYFVITQESAGIVTKCLKLRTKFVVMPRDYAFCELPARSDMKEDLQEKLKEMGYTYVVHNADELRVSLSRLDELKVGYQFNNTYALSKLKAVLESMS